MADNDWKKRLGVVFSTNPDFQFDTVDQAAVEEAVPASGQKLIVRLDRHARGGKQVTLVDGFRGGEAALGDLCRTLKVKLGVGGSAKDGQIVIQGDFRDRVVEILKKEGYCNAKRGN